MVLYYKSINLKEESRYNDLSDFLSWIRRLNAALVLTTLPGSEEGCLGDLTAGAACLSGVLIAAGVQGILAWESTLST